MRIKTKFKDEMGLRGLLERAPLERLGNCNGKGGQDQSSAINGKKRFVYW